MTIGPWLWPAPDCTIVTVNDIWVCGPCRSVNDARHRRCYRCDVPRTAANLTAASDAIRASTVGRDAGTRAVVALTAAPYRQTWPVAVSAAVLIAIATILSALHARAFTVLGASTARYIAGNPAWETAMDLSVVLLGVFVLAFLAWSVWLALIVRNVPALTGRQPRYSALGAFASAFIPFLNLERPQAVIRNVLGLLAPDRGWPRLVVLGWWAAILLTYAAPLVLAFARGRRSMASIAAGLEVRVPFLFAAAVLAIVVIVLVEVEQRRALQRHRSAGIVPDAVPA